MSYATANVDRSAEVELFVRAWYPANPNSTSSHNANLQRKPVDSRLKSRLQEGSLRPGDNVSGGLVKHVKQTCLGAGDKHVADSAR